MSPGRLFDYFRFCRGESQHLIASKIYAAAKQSASLRQALEREGVSTEREVRRFVRNFESGRGRVSNELIRQLVQFYGVTSPLLASFLDVTAQSGIVMNCRANLTRLVDPTSVASYDLPRHRLAESDISVAFVEYEPGTKSKVGSHPGDEFIYVLGGEVDVCFPQSGLQTRLNKGEYIQFHAERPHFLHAPSMVLSDTGKAVGNSKAELLVVRFFQFRTTSHRAAIRKLLLGSGRAKPKSDFAELLWQEISWLATFNQIGTYENGKRVIDFHGLSRLAVMLSSGGYRKGGSSPPLTRVDGEQLASRAKELARASSPNESSFLKQCTPSFFDDALHVGKWGSWRLDKAKRVTSPHLKEIGITREQLWLLASVYGDPVDVSPILFHEFLYPAERGVIRVAQDEWASMSWESMDDKSRQSQVEYFIPTRRLALSDAAVFRVRFQGAQPDKPVETPENRHPGSELCFCLSGAVHVIVDGELSQTINTNCFAHFKSSKCHHVSNLLPEPAEILVVRFYGDEHIRQGR